MKLNLLKLSKVLSYASTVVDAATALNHSQEYKHKEKVNKALSVSKTVLGVSKSILSVIGK